MAHTHILKMTCLHAGGKLQLKVEDPRRGLLPCVICHDNRPFPRRLAGLVSPLLHFIFKTPNLGRSWQILMSIPVPNCCVESRQIAMKPLLPHLLHMIDSLHNASPLA